MNKWVEQIPRIKEMGFNWVYVNPFHYPGFSGSLYAPKDYFAFSPLFLNPGDSRTWQEQLADTIAQFHKKGIMFMMDLVINHTAKDSILVSEHPQWYKHKEDGSILSPGALDNGEWIEWGDLAEIDNENSEDKDALWHFWDELTAFYQKLGVDGFRCDAAYLVPSSLWEYLISSAKKREPHTVFAAETLGCTIEQAAAIADTGFDYIFNSSKYWDYAESWFISQNNKLCYVVPSISFPETHDTTRLYQDYEGRCDLVEARYAFEAFISTGVLITIGFEFGFTKKCDVVHTTPDDWEEVNTEFTPFITKINEIKNKFEILRVDAELRLLNDADDSIAVLLKSHKNAGDKALFLINKDIHNWQHFYSEDMPAVAENANEILDISYEHPVSGIDKVYDFWIKPGGIRILLLKTNK